MSVVLNAVMATSLLVVATGSALGPHLEPPLEEDDPWPDALREVEVPEPLAWLVDLDGCSAYRLTFLRVAEYVVWQVASPDEYELHGVLARELAFCGFVGSRN